MAQNSSPTPLKTFTFPSGSTLMLGGAHTSKPVASARLALELSANARIIKVTEKRTNKPDRVIFVPVSAVVSMEVLTEEEQAVILAPPVQIENKPKVLANDTVKFVKDEDGNIKEERV